MTNRRKLFMCWAGGVLALMTCPLLPMIHQSLIIINAVGWIIVTITIIIGVPIMIYHLIKD